MQINSPTTLLLGDQNRVYKVRIACLEVDSSKQDLATEWMKGFLPRHSKVNIKPKAFEDGVLVASLVDIDSNKEIAKEMESKGLGVLNCS